MRKNNKTITLDLKAITPYLPSLIFTAVFLFGILLGCLSVGKYTHVVDGSASYVNEHLFLRSNATLWLRIKEALLSYFPTYICVFLLGASVIGCVTAPFSLAFIGFSYGCVASYLYKTYELVGVMYCALVVLPGMLVCCFGLIFLAKEAFLFSKTLCEICIMNSKPINVYASFRAYCIRFGTLIICAVVAVILDVGMASLFSKYFSL